ncbi:high affinity cAMP-specific and IBMX-insensitive 3',5'-cyclic phosphodiesterase 8B-like isoform X1 [Haliotis rufescens]|uniref:high affinity cAMP-specific and IBMX-insensitive 3',5'-cyclic phosphodiesterase 8B-like isoform X1 n=1 Tax=Haliotis rufescens TaxID=6454 RepID=UPI001EAFBBD7|nr:high affinity cAMP-specific and IBMX-insensitive 3',5'-cyclic phosphodiesterase 8B-like isoform X1 [Haliotis rufescens]
MGCTPSIHVSQTGVVYCRESDDSNSPRPSYSTTTYHAAHGQIIRTEVTDTSVSSPYAGSISGKPNMKITTTENEISFGPLKLNQHTMSILLVFAKEDAQSDGFWCAADRIGYKCNISRNPEGALECFLDKHHDLVVIDHRSTKHFDAEALCRSIRATKASEHTVLVAVTKGHTTDKEEPSILQLLKSGFNRRYIEKTNVGSCINELLSLEHGEVRSQIKLKACIALFTALDNVSDAVEITNEENEIQYVNHGYERLTGYTSEEVCGQDARELPRSDKNKPDLQETINGQLKKGKYWEGTYHTRRKSGETIPHHCRVAPVLGPGGKICQFVSVRTSPLDLSQHMDRVKDSDYTPLANGGIHGFPKRRESVARIHSMTIEAPITKVINIINAAQENCPLTVVQSLDRVLDILRTSELYSPYFAQRMKDEDPMTSDLVGGLVSQNMKRRLSGHDTHIPKTTHHPHAHIPSSPTALTQIPENIQAILENEKSWDFHIIELEKGTNKRPLVFLGLQIFSRFGVCEYLNISETCLTNWLQLIEASYHACNPYHNSTHAADVLHATAYFLDKERVKNVFDQGDEVAALIAAVIHDVDHPARTNAFLINDGNSLALLYNDVAVLENHHAALAFQLTHRDENVNIFKNLEKDEYRQMRQMIIDMVLATEMKQHFEHLSKFVNSINKSSLRSEEEMSESSHTSHDTLLSVAQLSTPENRILIKRMLIKCADVSNPVRPIDLCVEWAKRIAEEYFSQTDEEKDRKLPVVMPVFDRKSCSIPKSQTSFIDVFIQTMFEAWDQFSDIPELMSNLQDNYKYWKEKEEMEKEGETQDNSIQDDCSEQDSIDADSGKT